MCPELRLPTPLSRIPESNLVPALRIISIQPRRSRPLLALPSLRLLDLLPRLLHNPQPAASAEPCRTRLQHLDRVLQTPNATGRLNLHLPLADARLVQVLSRADHELHVGQRGAGPVEAGGSLDEVQVCGCSEVRGSEDLLGA